MIGRYDLRSCNRVIHSLDPSGDWCKYEDVVQMLEGLARCAVDDCGGDSVCDYIMDELEALNGKEA